MLVNKKFWIQFFVIMFIFCINFVYKVYTDTDKNPYKEIIYILIFIFNIVCRLYFYFKKLNIKKINEHVEDSLTEKKYNNIIIC